MGSLVLLFNPHRDYRDELFTAAAHIPVYTRRTLIPSGSLVFGRYSVLPNYDEVWDDVLNLGSRLVNTPEQHRYIADFDYYEDIKDLTFKSWRFEEFPYVTDPGPFVVKGATNSKKFQWNKKMFAPTKADAIRIACDLMEDSMIGSQQIIVRKYEELVSFEEGINGLDFANEWRTFVWRGKMVSGYYWANVSEETLERAMTAEALTPEGAPEGVIGLVRKVVDRVEGRVEVSGDAYGVLKDACYVVDVAKTKQGEWKVVELNDGQMSGLSDIPEDRFYAELLLGKGDVLDGLCEDVKRAGVDKWTEEDCVRFVDEVRKE